MAVTYIVSEHPLLSPKAKALVSSEEAFAEQTALAASLLGVDETVYVDDDLAKVNRAIALQVNYQIELSAKPDIWYAQSVASSHSKQSVTYRGGASGPSLIFPQAMQLVKGVQFESGWDNIKAVR